MLRRDTVGLGANGLNLLEESLAYKTGLLAFVMTFQKPADIFSVGDEYTKERHCWSWCQRSESLRGKSSLKTGLFSLCNVLCIGLLEAFIFIFGRR